MLVVLRGESPAGGFLTVSSWGDSASRVRFPVPQPQENTASSAGVCTCGKQLYLTAHIAEPMSRCGQGCSRRVGDECPFWAGWGGPEAQAEEGCRKLTGLSGHTQPLADPSGAGEETL